MTNENNSNISQIEETGINRKFFEEVIETSNLSSEDKKKIGEFKEFKNDTESKVLKVGEKEKIKAYDKLKVKELPEDWEFKLARIEELEKNQADYLKKKEELKGWTDTFGEKKPTQIQEVINLLEEKNKEIGEEVITEKEKHSLTEKELKGWKEVFLNQTALQLKQKISELEEKVKEWTHFFDYRELAEIKKEIEELRKRPEISISEKQFWDDYAQRKSLGQNELEMEELVKEREKVEEYKRKNEELRQSIDQVLEDRRTKRYILVEPVLNSEQAQSAIAKLLTETENSWQLYLKSGKKENLATKDLILSLSFWDKDKKERAYQILAWIKEAKNTLEYQKLFERWNGREEYNKEHDFDGSLYLLKNWLEVKDTEPTK